jgi:branched-subunit amino acid transport protein
VIRSEADAVPRATASAALAGVSVPSVLVAWTQPEWMSAASVFLMATLLAVLLVLRTHGSNAEGVVVSGVARGAR